jgi:hypothetical protein
MTVGVEINPTTPITGHPMQTKGKQAFKISQGTGNLKHDITKITISDAANWSGQYNLGLTKRPDDEGNVDIFLATEITVGGSTSELKNKIKDFYSNQWGSEITVTEECFDASDVLLTDDVTGE